MKYIINCKKCGKSEIIENAFTNSSDKEFKKIKYHHLISCGEEPETLLRHDNTTDTVEDCEQCRHGTPVSHNGSTMCRTKASIASGGTKAHCTCRACF